MTREDGVLAAQGVHQASIVLLRKLAPDVAIAQATDFVLVEVADEVAHQFRPRVLGGPDSVPQQLLEHVGTVSKRHPTKYYAGLPAVTTIRQRRAITNLLHAARHRRVRTLLA